MKWLLFILAIALFLLMMLALEIVAGVNVLQFVDFRGGGLMEILIFLFVAWCIAPMFICHYLAKEKGRDSGGFVVLAFFFGWIAVLVVACMQDSMRKTLSDQAELERLKALQRAQDEKQ